MQNEGIETLSLSDHLLGTNASNHSGWHKRK